MAQNSLRCELGLCGELQGPDWIQCHAVVCTSSHNHPPTHSPTDPLSQSLCPALCRYMRFLVLWRENPDLETLVPMIDIDLMWHAHMAHSGMYACDMEAFNNGQVCKTCPCTTHPLFC